MTNQHLVGSQGQHVFDTHLATLRPTTSWLPTTPPVVIRLLTGLSHHRFRRCRPGHLLGKRLYPRWHALPRGCAHQRYSRHAVRVTICRPRHRHRPDPWHWFQRVLCGRRATVLVMICSHSDASACMHHTWLSSWRRLAELVQFSWAIHDVIYARPVPHCIDIGHSPPHGVEQFPQQGQHAPCKLHTAQSPHGHQHRVRWLSQQRPARARGRRVGCLCQQAIRTGTPLLVMHACV